MIFRGRQLNKFSWSGRAPSRVSLAKSLAIFCVLGLATVASAASGPGYLRTVGPAPLRFWSPPPRTPETAATNAAPAAAQASAPNPYDFMNAFGAQPPLVMEATSTSGPSPMTPITPAPDQSAPANPDQNGSSTTPQSGDVVSPQMFLKYFNKNTNGAQTSIYMPVDSNAVHQNQPPPPPPSSATYSN